MKNGLIFNLLILMLSVSWAQAHVCDNKDKFTKVVKKGVGYLAKVGFDTDIDLFKVGVNNVINLETTYILDVEKSAENVGVYSRIDAFKIGLPAGLNSELDDDKTSDTNPNLSYTPSITVRFTRHFDDPCKAILERPYFVTEMPFQVMGNKKSPSKTVLEELNVGDMVSTKGLVRFVVGIEHLRDVGIVDALHLEVQGGVAYIIEGFFTVHVVKIDKKRVTVRLVNEKGKMGTANIKVGLIGEVLLQELGLVTGTSLVDKLLGKLLDFKIYKFDIAMGSRKAAAIEYHLNLTDPQVAAAFDRMMKVSNGYNTVERAHDLFWGASINHLVSVNTLDLEKLYQRDLQRGNLNSVVRGVKAESKGTKAEGEMEFDLQFLKLGTKGLSMTEKITIFDKSNNPSCGIVSTKVEATTGSVLFGLLRLHREREMTAVSKSSCQFDQSSPENVVMTWARRYNSFDSEKAQSIKKQLLRTLPESLTRTVRFGVPNTEFRARAGYQLVLDATKLGLFVKGAQEKIKNNQYKLGSRAIEELYVKYLYELSQRTDMNLVSDLLKVENPGPSTAFQQRVYGSNPFINQLSGTIPAIAEGLSRMLDDSPSVTTVDRLAELMALRNNPLFAQTGMGFLMSLITPRQASEIAHVGVYLPGAESQSIGNERAISRVYRTFVSARNALKDGDIKLMSELAYLGSTGRTPQKLWNPFSWWDRSEDAP